MTTTKKTIRIYSANANNGSGKFLTVDPVDFENEKSYFESINHSGYDWIEVDDDFDPSIAPAKKSARRK